MTMPRSPHAVARIVPKNPGWANKTTVIFVLPKKTAEEQSPRAAAEDPRLPLPAPHSSEIWATD